jgi:hypothetical protein
MLTLQTVSVEVALTVALPVHPIVPVLLAWQRIVRYQLPDALVLHLTPMFIVGIPYATLQARPEMLLIYITWMVTMYATEQRK